tara:strand:- start:454 stop:636 length:183 start_codon:yes stop_codon:yes gene_type:complete
MPIKFRPSTSVRAKNGTTVTKHSYMSGTSTAVLKEAAHANSTKPKMRDKIAKELVRRGEI